MNAGEALTIFENIESPDYEDGQKGMAVKTVMEMATHNSVSNCTGIVSLGSAVSPSGTYPYERPVPPEVPYSSMVKDGQCPDRLKLTRQKRFCTESG